MPGLVTEATAVARAIEGADAVISTLGPDGNTADQVVTLREGMRTVIGAFHDHGMRRIVNCRVRPSTRRAITSRGSIR